MSELEAMLEWQLQAVGVPKPIREYRFDPERKFRADFCWPESQLMVEVEGGTWTGGRHVTGSGVARDCEKSALAAIAGYRVVRVTGDQIKSGQAVAWIERALERAAAPAASSAGPSDASGTGPSAGRGSSAPSGGRARG